MTTHRMIALGIACLSVAGCGGGFFSATPSTRTTTTRISATGGSVPTESRQRYATYTPSSTPARAESEESPAPRSEASRPPSDYGYSVGADPVKPVEPTPESRPGLGTTFGETRDSRVREVSFERSGDRPLTVASIYYNDRTGVDAMANYDRRSSRIDAPVPIRGGLTASVIDESGRPLEGVSVGGRIYVVGEVGGRYALQVRNTTNRRYEIVASVDGLDVVDGNPASVDKRGYLIDPYGTITIDGFRRNHNEVAAFRFGAVDQSYAAKTSGDRNVGVIGLAFFEEQGVTPWSDTEIEKRRTAEPFSDARFAQPPPF